MLFLWLNYRGFLEKRLGKKGIRIVSQQPKKIVTAARDVVKKTDTCAERASKR